MVSQRSDILVAVLALVLSPYPGMAQNQTRDGKLISIFNVVTFSNDPCIGESRNGTCYTASECLQKGGAASGACASGYGVCCLFSLQCGGSSSENCTYFSQSSVSPILTNPCDYKICKCSSDICRIRFDFISFSIQGPLTGVAKQAATILNGGSIGQCLTDRFSITSPGKRGTPEICGFNSGQHVFLDASDECQVASFFLSGSGSRSWEVKVTQYNCGEERGGPEGCLQYFSGNTGIISSFNFPTTGQLVGSEATHLANQCYDICVRRESGKCAVCYSPNVSVLAATAIAQTTFGLSLSPDDAAKSAVGTLCSTDFILILGAEDVVSGASLAIGSIATGFTSKICGNIFSSLAGVAAADAYDATIDGKLISVCTQQTPFRISFKTDQTEVVGDDTKTSDAETAAPPAGIIGFSLSYKQVDC